MPSQQRNYLLVLPPQSRCIVADLKTQGKRSLASTERARCIDVKEIFSVMIEMMFLCLALKSFAFRQNSFTLGRIAR